MDDKLDVLQERGCKISRINKKAHMIKKSSETVLHKVYKVSFNSATPKIERFSKGVWGIRLPLHLLAVVDVVS